VSNIQPDYFKVLGGQGPGAGIALFLLIVLVLISVVTMIPPGTFGEKSGCSNAPLVLLGWFGMPVLPFIISYVTYQLLEMAITVPLYLILCTNLIAYTICLPAAYIFKRWLMSNLIGRYASSRLTRAQSLPATA
jgi:hypothetical protein